MLTFSPLVLTFAASPPLVLREKPCTKASVVLTPKELAAPAESYIDWFRNAVCRFTVSYIKSEQREPRGGGESVKNRSPRMRMRLYRR